MKSIPLFILYFFTLFSAQEAWTEGCNQEMQKYVIRGDLNSKAVGARLWRLSDLKADAKSKKPCAQNLFKQAIAEADSYWTHIDTKYSCGVMSNQNSDKETCSNSLNDKVLSNKSYLAMIKAESDFSGGNCPLNSSNHNLLLRSQRHNIADIASVLANATDEKNKCDGVPERDRIDLSSGVSPASDLVEGVTKQMGSCLWGLIKGFFQEGIFKSIKSIWDELKDPWATLAAVRDVAKEMLKDPSGTLARIAQNMTDSIYSTFLQKYENFDCYNVQKKSEILCSSIGQGAATVVEALLGAKVFSAGSKILKNLKGTSKGKGKALEGEFIEAPKKLPGPKTKKTGTTVNGKFSRATEIQNRSIIEPSQSSRLEDKSSSKNKKSAGDLSTIPDQNLRENQKRPLNDRVSPIKPQKAKTEKAPTDSEAPASPRENASKQEPPPPQEEIQKPAFSKQDVQELVSRYKKFGTISNSTLIKYLKLPPEADKKEVIKALKSIQQQIHPDKNPGDVEAGKLFKSVNDIYKEVKKEP